MDVINEIRELDAVIAEAERLLKLAVECGFGDLAKMIERDLRDTKAWRDMVAEALNRAPAARESPLPVGRA